MAKSLPHASHTHTRWSLVAKRRMAGQTTIRRLNFGQKNLQTVAGVYEKWLETPVTASQLPFFFTQGAEHNSCTLGLVLFHVYLRMDTITGTKSNRISVRRRYHTVRYVYVQIAKVSSLRYFDYLTEINIDSSPHRYTNHSQGMWCYIVLSIWWWKKTNGIKIVAFASHLMTFQLNSANFRQLAKSESGLNFALKTNMMSFSNAQWIFAHFLWLI